MSTDIKHLPADWSKTLGIEALDADGWRADGQPWGRAITEADFRRRAAMSTMREVTPAPLDRAALRDALTDVDVLKRDPETGISYIDPDLATERLADLLGLPAPEPEPEWEPGTRGTAKILVGEDEGSRRIVTRLTGNEHAFETIPLVWGDLDGNRYAENEVTDFVPDEPRPLPTWAEIHNVIISNWSGDIGARRTTDAVEALLRGESR